MLQDDKEPSVKIHFIPLIRVLLFLILLVATTSAALAQTPTPDTSAISADRVNEVARGLWCPLCSGVRLDACELKACVQMKEMIAIKLAEGASEEAIRAYFLEQYGPQVFGEPPREGFNWLAWILPVVGLLGGGLFVWFVIRRMIRSEPIPAVASAKSAAPPDDYSQKLEQELSRYD
ncbi:MAG: cytochrome c-type biogenesis protein CcmH [Chloroflexi bacterium]|nr:cytochrome c-type biogenesis protein CcmH [Chloroflexota bacterium]